MKRVCRACEADISARHARAVICKSCRSAISRDPVARAAHKAVADARRHGLLPSPASFLCADCGGSAALYDHREYAQPLKVDPVCRSCNVRRGSAIDAMARKSSPTNQRGA